MSVRWVNCAHCGVLNLVPGGSELESVYCWMCSSPVGLEWGARPDSGACPWCDQHMPMGE